MWYPCYALFLDLYAFLRQILASPRNSLQPPSSYAAPYPRSLLHAPLAGAPALLSGLKAQPEFPELIGVVETGARVRLTKLKAQPELNGREGVVERFDPSKQRFVVRLRNECKLIRESNLMLLR